MPERFLVDSIQMVFATQRIFGHEKRADEDSLNVAPKQLVIAHDLIAVIVNPDSGDTVFSLNGSLRLWSLESLRKI